jgi:hypothetical protein
MRYDGMSEQGQTKKFFDENMWNPKWKKVRIISSVILILALGLVVIFESNSLFNLTGNLPAETGIDWREISVLIMTGIIVSWLRLPDDFVADLKNRRKERAKFSLLLLLFLVGIVAIWFAVRAIGLFVFSITTELNRSPIRQASSVFSLIGYVIAANLPFTLLRAYRTGVPPKGDRNVKNNENAYEQSLWIIKGTIDVILQAIFIVLLTFIPVVGQKVLLQDVGGFIGFATIFFSIVVTLVVFLMVRKRIYSEMLTYK